MEGNEQFQVTISPGANNLGGKADLVGPAKWTNTTCTVTIVDNDGIMLPNNYDILYLVGICKLSCAFH